MSQRSKQGLVGILLLAVAYPVAADRYQVVAATAATARASYQTAIERLRRDATRLAIRSCEDREWAGYRCLADSRGEISPRTFVPPFPVWGAFGQYNMIGPAEWYGWAPAEMAKGGAEAVARWRQLAATGSNFACIDGSCQRIVEAVSPGLRPGHRVLALCSAAATRRSSAPPEGCNAVAVLTPEQTWVRVYHWQENIGGAGLSDFLMAVFRQVALSSDQVLGVIATTLGQAPWSLEVEGTRSGLVAYTGRRVSPLLRRKREQLTIRVDGWESSVSTRTLGQVHLVSLSCSTTVYVNDLNTTQERDWHLPTREQHDTYVGQLKASFRETLSRRCSQASWVDSLRLACDLPASRELLQIGID